MSVTSLQPLRSTPQEITTQDIHLLNRYFSTKTILEVNLDCDEDARQILHASLTDPPIRHAISSLRALRKELEQTGEAPASLVQQTVGYDYGVEQYCIALRGLASGLSSPTYKGLKSALLCCQMFISIEQVRQDYAAMARHIIQGLRIMHEHWARPLFRLATNEVVPAQCDQLPFLDVFIIKLFAAPCKFAESPATTEISGTMMPVRPDTTDHQPGESRALRPIAPDMRAELTRIAVSTLAFLDKVLHVKLTEKALRLLSEKLSLLESLESWLANLEVMHEAIKPPGPLSVCFMRLFHAILKIVLLGTLDSPPNLNAELEIERDRLMGIASDVSERVKGYKMCSGTGIGRGE